MKGERVVGGWCHGRDRKLGRLGEGTEPWKRDQRISRDEGSESEESSKFGLGSYRVTCLERTDFIDGVGQIQKVFLFIYMNNL